MTSIASTTSSLGDSLAALITGTSGSAAPPAAAATASSGTTLSTGLGPATVVDLSDPAKAAVAKAKSDQAASARLQAYVEAHSANNKASGGSSAKKTAPNDPFRSLLDETTATPAIPIAPPTNAAVANIQAIADAEGPQPYVPFVPTRAVSGSLTFAGYTVNFSSVPSRLYSGLDVSGNGISAYSRHFWPSDGGGGVDAAPPGVSISIGSNPTNPAEDFVTISQNTASATSASVASSSGAAAATRAVSAQSSTVTFVVNYATGEISVKQSAASVSAKASATTFPGSLLSALA